MANKIKPSWNELKVGTDLQKQVSKLEEQVKYGG